VNCNETFRFNRCEHPLIAKCSIMKPVAVPVEANYEVVAISEEDDDDEDDYEYWSYGPTLANDADYKIKDDRCPSEEAEDSMHPIQFVHPNDCQMFYKCWAGNAYKANSLKLLLLTTHNPSLPLPPTHRFNVQETSISINANRCAISQNLLAVPSKLPLKLLRPLCK